MPVEALSLTGRTLTIPDDALAAFRKTMHGPVLTAGDDGYEDACVIWVTNYSRRRPALIARCRGTGDVVDAVNFAREHSLLTSVRGGGHSIQGFGNADGGLKIDLSLMSTVTIDREAQRARLQGGATLGDLDSESTRAGFAVPAGVVADTGVGGLTLGGGVGWLHRKYGLTIDNLVSAEVVTADGTVRRVSESSEPDLFWAIRGGGGNFGVVTEFEFVARPIPPKLAFVLVAYPLEEFRELSAKFRDWTRTASDEVTARLFSVTPTVHANMPAQVMNRDLVLIGALHCGDPEVGRAEIEPLRHFGTVLHDMSRDWTFREVQGAFDTPYSHYSAYFKSMYVEELSDEVLDITAAWTKKRPTPGTVTQLIHMGGAVSRVGGGDTAFGDRSAQYLISAEAAYVHDSDEEACTQWAQGLVGDLEPLPYSRGTYLNFNGALDETSRGEQFGANLKRLREIKREYDPGNLFRVNNNIPPA